MSHSLVTTGKTADSVVVREKRTGVNETQFLPRSFRKRSRQFSPSVHGFEIVQECTDSRKKEKVVEL